MTPIRFAILGYGLHAGRRIVPAFVPARHAILAGLWRRDQAAAAEACREHNIPHNFPTREALCASPDIDAVFIASPDVLHCDDTLLALAHGKAVLCEKPVSMNANESRRMAEAAATKNLLYGVAQNFRFNRSVRLFRDWIAEGRIGQPQLSAAQFCYPAQNSPRKWIADSTIAAGGPIADVGVHCIDALRYILAADVLSVNTIATDIEPPASSSDTMISIDPGALPLPPRDTTHAKKNSGTRLVETYASLQLEMTSNIAATITVSARTPYRTLLEVTGTNGVLTAENGLTVDRPVEVHLRRAGELTDTITLDNADAYTLMLDAFATSLRTGAPFAASGNDAINNMQSIDAAYLSWQTGHRERIQT